MKRSDTTKGFRQWRKAVIADALTCGATQLDVDVIEPHFDLSARFSKGESVAKASDALQRELANL